MEIEVKTGPVAETQAAALAIWMQKAAERELTGAAREIDEALGGQISALLEDGDFRAKGNETLVLYTQGRIPAKRVLLVGLGASDKITLDVLREAGATAAKKARQLGIATLHLSLPDIGTGALDASRRADALVEGVILGHYRYHELRTQLDDVRPDIERLTLVVPESEGVGEIREAVHTGRVLAESALLARDLINRPANIASPAHVVSAASELAEEVGLRCRVLDKAEMEELGMDLLLSVNRGSEEPAQMVILEHQVDEENAPTVVLVGKGITFDSGGLSLKSSQGMEKMKGDMGGAAAVLGALRAVALLDLPINVVGLAPLTENMPDARATRPGDVITSLKGLSVEIINTDAEGRLILADALTYAGEFAPDAIFDIATLTGGRIVALGAHAAAVMGDDDLIDRLTRAGETTGERVWQLPLFEEYGKQLKSDVADLKNTGGRAASTITAAFFLSKFVPEETPWVHIDIAGLGLTDDARPYIPKGGTGFGVRLLVEALRSWWR
ncbi:MAG: leucyl aminopeptidase [Anaerolineae bacterium]